MSIYPGMFNQGNIRIDVFDILRRLLKDVAGPGFQDVFGVGVGGGGGGGPVLKGSLFLKRG